MCTWYIVCRSKHLDRSAVWYTHTENHPSALADKQQTKRHYNCTKFFMLAYLKKTDESLRICWANIWGDEFDIFFHLVNLFICDEWGARCCKWRAAKINKSRFYATQSASMFYIITYEFSLWQVTANQIWGKKSEKMYWARSIGINQIRMKIELRIRFWESGILNEILRN